MGCCSGYRWVRIRLQRGEAFSGGDDGDELRPVFYFSSCHLSVSSLCLISYLSSLCRVSEKEWRASEERVEMRREKDWYLLLPYAISHLSLSHLSAFFFVLNSDLSCLRRHKERTKHNLHLWIKKIKGRDCNPCVFLSTNRFFFFFLCINIY